MAHIEIVKLNDFWRVIDDGKRQWILQRRYSNKWKSKSYCTSKAGLIRCVHAMAEPIKVGSFKVIDALPEYYPLKQRLEEEKERRSVNRNKHKQTAASSNC